MTVTDDYLANNAEYAKTFNGPLPLPPSKLSPSWRAWTRDLMSTASSASKMVRRM